MATPMKLALKKLIGFFGYGLFPLGTIPMDTRRIQALIGLTEAYKLVADIPGTIVECGVGKGRTFLFFTHLASRESRGRTVWGFDSFGGFPEPAPEDDSARKPRKGEWSGTSPDDILRILHIAGVSPDFIRTNVKLVPGFFDKSLAGYDRSPIALLHIDADLYQSYRDVFRVLEPLVVPGGVILFDEYNEDRWPGASKAVDEYLAQTGKTLRTTSSGKYYVIK